MPPTGVNTPDFSQIARGAKKHAKPNQWFRIPKRTLRIGLDDSNEAILPKASFGWDNEKPQRIITVHSFEAQARPITNGEYFQYLQALRLSTMPASWVSIASEKEYPISGGITSSYSGGSSAASKIQFEEIAVRTVFGPVPLILAQDWPLMASYDELASYAKWMGCRIPTFEETQSIYMQSEKLREEATSENSHYYRSVQSRCWLLVMFTNLFL